MKTLILYNPGNSEAEQYIPVIMKSFSESGINASSTDELSFGADDGISFLTVLGGDGSIMRAAKYAACYDIPVLGVNFGRIGYLASLDPCDTDLISKIVNNEYVTEDAMMLRIECNDGVYYSLNDAVVANGTVSRMASLELDCDGSSIGIYHADGLIAATPTGSTAYSLSAGGPVIDPAMKCILITPVCSHLRSSSPIVFSEDSVISITNSGTREQVYLTVDGSDNYAIPLGGTVRISKSERSVKFIRLKQDGFFERLRKVQDRS